jgi:uncharacterized protein YdhG (YjbR/CyaY superfamily)
MEDNKSITTIDEYIAQFPAEIRARLESLRKVIRETAPEANEKISYNMPTFTLNGNLVHFAAHKSHIGFYPTPSGIEVFKDKLSEYNSSKGAVQFPNSKPLPLELIKEIVSFRVSENTKK